MVRVVGFWSVFSVRTQLQGYLLCIFEACYRAVSNVTLQRYVYVLVYVHRFAIRLQLFNFSRKKKKKNEEARRKVIVVRHLLECTCFQRFD